MEVCTLYSTGKPPTRANEKGDLNSVSKKLFIIHVSVGANKVQKWGGCVIGFTHVAFRLQTNNSLQKETKKPLGNQCFQYPLEQI